MLILLVYLLLQLTGGVVVILGAVLVAAFQGQNIQDPEVVQTLTQSALAPAALGAFLLGVLGAVPLSIFFARTLHGERSPRGIAWCWGDRGAVQSGLLWGVALALGYLAIPLWLVPAPPVEEMGPLAQMGMTPGVPRMIWLVMALLLAPVTEEYLFRGVFLAGLSRSLGVPFGVTLTTVLFVLLHVSEAIHYWPSFLGISALGIVAVGLRLKTRSLGPAIAVHWGYNAVLAMTAILSTSSNAP